MGAAMEYVNNAVAVGTLGTVDPNKKKPFSGGVFYGKEGAADYGQQLLHHVTLGLGAEPPGHQQKEADVLDRQARTARDQADAASSAEAAAEAERQARIETPQEATDSRRRARDSAQRLGAGKRRASQTLTDPGTTLSGSY